MAKLTPEQKKIILMIEEEAVKAGVDPDFAVALANLESSFQHIPADDKKSTAYGPFQVNKATAEANGVDYDKMKDDPRLAVKTGVMNIARHAKNPEFQGDPMRIAAAHRYGENSEFAKTGDFGKIDKTLAGYLASAMEHFPDEEFPQTVYTPPKAQEKAAPEPSAAPVDMDMGSVPLGAANPQEQAILDAEQQSWDRATAAAGAGATGAAFGAVKVPTLKILHRLSKALPETKVSVEDAAKLAEKVATGQIPAAPGTTPSPAAPGATGTPGVSIMRQQPPMGPADAGRMASGQTGAQVYNYAKAAGLTDIEAARALDMTKEAGGVHDLSTQRRMATQKIGQLFPTETWRENPMFGGIVTTDPGVGRGPRATYTYQTEIPPNPELPQGRAAGLAQHPPRKPVPTTIPPMPEVTIPRPQASPDAIQRGVRYVMGSSPVKWGLAGAGVGYNLEDAYQKFRDDQILGGLTSLGAAGASGLTLVPKYAARANPAAIGLTTASQVMGDLARGDRQAAAESGLTGAVMLAPRVMGPLGAVFYSSGLNKGEQEELERRRKLAPTVTP